VTPATVRGGAAATGTVTLHGAAPAGGVSVPLTSSHAAACVPATVDVPGRHARDGRDHDEAGREEHAWVDRHELRRCVEGAAAPRLAALNTPNH